MLPLLPVIRHNVRTVDDPPVFHEPEGIHQKCSQAFPANPNQGNHGGREGGHAEDDDARGQRQGQVDNRNPNPGCKHSPFDGIPDLKHPAHECAAFHKITRDQSYLLFFRAVHGVTSSVLFPE